MSNVRPLQTLNGTTRQVPTTDTLNVSGMNAPSTPLTLDGSSRRIDIAGVPYTWPSVNGVAGAALVDTDGAGNLSWQVGGGGGGVTSVGASAPVTSTGGTTPVIGLSDSGVSTGTYGTASSVSQFTVTAKGLVSSASNVSIQIAEAQVTNLTTDLSGKVPTTTQVIAGTGLTGGGALTSNVTLSMPNVGTAGTYGSASQIPSFTTDAQGRVTAVSVFNPQFSTVSYLPSATQTITLATQQFLVTTSHSTNTITVQRGALPGGSGIALSTASRQLTPGALLSLIYDGTYWLETAFSTPTT